jgi:uncharacterized protein YfiM (DUF2279 family)
MQQAVKFQFGRAVQEYADWRAVEDKRRSPAASWWWSSALATMDQQEAMPPEWCRSFELAAGSSFAAGARLIMNAITEQKSLPWPDQFPRMPEWQEH